MVNAGSSNPHSKYEPNTVVGTFPTLHHPLAPSRQGALTLRSLGNHFVPKNHPFPPELVKSVNLQKHTLGEEKQGHFSSCQLWSLASSTTIEGKRQVVGQGVYIEVKIKVSSSNYAYFATKMSQNTHHFFMPSFPMQKQTHNNQLEKRGKTRETRRGQIL